MKLNKFLLATLFVGTSFYLNAQKKDSTDYTLDQVVITGSGYEQKIKDAPATISVITQKEIKMKAYRDITDALQDVPGVFITGGGSTSDFSIRGTDSSHTMVLIDGKRVNSRETRPNSDGPGIEQGWMPPIEEIERIEVIKGPMSSLYGSDAMGGVINIITKKSTNQWRGTLGTNGTVQTHSAAGNTYQINGYTSGSIVKDLLKLKVGANYSEREEDKFLNGFTERVIKSVDAQLDFTPTKKDVFSFAFNHNRQERNQTPGKTLAATATATKNHYDRNAFTLSHAGDYNNFHTKSYFQYDKTQNPTRNMDYSTIIANTINNFNIKKHTITFGGEYRYENLEDQGNKLAIDGVILNKLTRWNFSLFAEANWKIFEKLNLVTGARYDNDENYGSNFTPRAYVVYDLNNNFTIKGGVSSGYKAPALRAVSPGWGQTTGGGQSNGMIVGNPDLKPEKSVNYEATVMFEDDSKRFNISATAYLTDFKEKLVEERICNNAEECAKYENVYGEIFDFISIRNNIDKARMKGIEVSTSIKIVHNLNLKANYTYTETLATSGKYDGYNLNRLPKNMANSTLSWETSKHVQLWTRWNYRGKTTGGISRNTYNPVPIPEYNLFDLGSVFNFTKSLQMTFGVYNIFDKKIINDTTLGTNNYGFRIDGLRYQVGATFKF
ncbi:TonB-dependent receptor domain-containing protein [Chishuiella sp.]|uniref:TonB-dependent receptor domain-containing protein n=1 Tax=Chishuiella sp. TaxID=1969467 RepID=UPI0028ABEF73|nr:TonB-dependent receptor [Chishuiella sp.]